MVWKARHLLGEGWNRNVLRAYYMCWEIEQDKGRGGAAPPGNRRLNVRVAEADAELECSLGQEFGLFLGATADVGLGTLVDNGREYRGGHLLVESIKPRKVFKEDLEDDAVSLGFIRVVQRGVDKRVDLVDGLFEIHHDNYSFKNGIEGNDTLI